MFEVSYSSICVFTSLVSAHQECSCWKEVCPLSLQLSADLQSDVAEDRLSKTVLVSQEKKQRLFLIHLSFNT